jgi:hypothetical protein
MAADDIYLTLASIVVCPRALDIRLPRTRITKCQVIEFFHVDMTQNPIPLIKIHIRPIKTHPAPKGVCPSY